jgi:ketosteroid isomerase-like protein
VDSAAVIAGVAEAWNRWAVADTAGNLDAIMDLVTEDGRMDAKGFPPMLGREAARAVYTPLYAQVDYLEARATPEMTVVISNELAHQTGTVMERYTMKGQQGEMMDHARYAAAFVKGADGLWRWAYMMYMVDSTVTKK